MTGKVSTTLRVLNDLRDEQARTREEIAELRQEIREGLVQLQRVFTTELGAVGGVLVDVRDLLRDRLDLRDEVRDHDRRISALERRAG